MAGRAAIARHPIHPMLVVFPIGLWIFSFACDLVYHWGNHALFWKDVAFYTMVGGVVGALLAALPGLVDYLALVGQRVKRIATSHMVLNLVVVVLYVVNLVWRGTSAPPDAAGPVWLSLGSLILLTISGWLGGELVYVEGVAVEPHTTTSIEVKPSRVRPSCDVRHQA